MCSGRLVSSADFSRSSMNDLRKAERRSELSGGSLSAIAFRRSSRTVRFPSPRSVHGSLNEKHSGSNHGAAKAGRNAVWAAENFAGIRSSPGRTKAKGRCSSSRPRERIHTQSEEWDESHACRTEESPDEYLSIKSGIGGESA